MDEQARKERLELMMARKIAVEEKQEMMRLNMEEQRLQFLEKNAQARTLRRNEIAEMQRLRRENTEEARQQRKAIQAERRAIFAAFCDKAADFLDRETKSLRMEEPSEMTERKAVLLKNGQDELQRITKAADQFYEYVDKSIDIESEFSRNKD